MFRCRLSLPLAAACLAPLAAAQVGPGVIRGPAANGAFPTGLSYLQIYTDQLLPNGGFPGDPAGSFTCCVTTEGASQKVEIGTYDQTAGTYVPTGQAAALDMHGVGEVALSLEPQWGRYAVFSTAAATSTAGYFFASRSVAGTPFGAPVPIPGVPATTFQMALGYVGQTLKLFMSDVATGRVTMQTLDVTNLAAPVLTGPVQVVAAPVGTSMGIFYVTTTTGPDGDVEGLLMSQWDGSYSTDVIFQPGLDPTRGGGVVVSGTTTSTVRGCALAGGRVLFASGSPGAFRVHDVEMSWLLGDTGALGGTADIVAGVSAPGATTLLLFGATVAQQPVTLPRPFHVGAFGLNPLPVLVHAGNLAHVPGTGLATLQLPIAYNAALAGASVAMQGLSVDASLTPLAWTNTAWLDL